MSLSIVIPCYNEADGVDDLTTALIQVLPRLSGWDPVEVLVVDDGSADGTADRLERTSQRWEAAGSTFRVVRHAANQGLGAALRTGFAATTGEVVVTTDSDATYAFAEIPRLLDRLAPDVDLVTASPYHPAGRVRGVTTFRLALSRGASAIYRVLVDRRIRTYTSLFRAYRRHVLEEVPFSSRGYLAVAEILVNARLMGYRIAEYPAVLARRRHGFSKAKVARIVGSHLRFQGDVVLRRAGLRKLPPRSRPGPLAQPRDRTS